MVTHKKGAKNKNRPVKKSKPASANGHVRNHTIEENGNHLDIPEPQNFKEPVAKKPEPTPELEKNVVEDENGWETAPGKNKKGKMNKGGKGKKPEVKPAEPAPVVQERKSVAAPKTEPKKEHKKEMSDNSDPVKVEPVEVVKPVEMEPKKESPPPPKEEVEKPAPVAEITEKMEDLAVQEAPKENGISEPETNDSVFESASTEAAKAAAEIKTETLATTPTSVTPEVVSTPDAGTPKGITPEPPVDSEPSTPTSDDPQALKEFENLASKNRARISAGEKVTYERSFLLKFQPVCHEKPTQLPNLDVILDKPTDGHRQPPEHKTTRTDFSPAFLPKNNRHNRGPGRRGSAQQKNTIKLPSRANVELHKAENKFVRGIAKDLDETEKITAKMLRDAKAILNKLTPEKEENLTRRFVNEIQPDSYDRLVRLVNDLFNKAIEEKHFAQLYARLCKTCHIRWTDMDRFQFACRPNGEHIQEEMSKQDIMRAPQKFKLKSFREVLLSRAQQEFNKLKKLNSQDKDTFEKDSYEWRRLDTKEKLDALPKKDSPEYNEKEHKRKELELKEEYEDLNNRIKIRSMGNTRFVGELYMIQLLSANIMSGCIGQLVHSNSETELESLCKLIEAIGEKYSTEDKGKERLPMMFQTIEKVISSGLTQPDPRTNQTPTTVSPRIICLLTDIIDLQRRGWNKRQGTAVSGPAKISDLHKNHEKKQMQDAKRIERQISDRNHARSMENKNMRSHRDAGNWTSMPVRREKFDASKLAGGSKPRDEAPLSLGPKRRGKMGKGSSMDGRNSTPDTTPSGSGRNTPVSTESVNPFSMLSDAGEDASGFQPVRTQSNRFDNRRRSERNNEMGPPRGLPRNRNQTHDGRMDKKKLSPEEVNEINQEVKRKAQTVFSDIQEAVENKMPFNEIIKDIKDQELCASAEHQKILVEELIEKVIEGKENERLQMAKFFLDLIDNIKNMNFLTILPEYIKSQIEDDRMTDCPKFWEYFGMIIGELFKSPNLDPKLLALIVEQAKENMQCTKAAVSILNEIKFALKSKGKIHAVYTESGISIADCLKADDIEDDPAERLDRFRLAFLLEPYVEIKWRDTEKGLVDMLEDHEFEGEDPDDFSKEFDFVEKMVPPGRDGRDSYNFVQVIVNAAMTYSVDKERHMLIRRDMTEEGSETRLSDCELLLRKYLDNKIAQIDTLFVLAQFFEKHNNNATLVKETFNELFEINVIDIDAFMRWKEKAKSETNYPIILAATRSFYEALAAEKEVEKDGEKKAESQS